MNTRPRSWTALVLATAWWQASSGCGDDRIPATPAKPGIIAPAAGGSAGAAQRAPSRGTAGAAGSPGSELGAGGSGTMPSAAALGAPCEDAGACAGLDCLEAGEKSLGEGGPPGGLCTIACRTHEDCQTLGGRCLDFGDNAYCVQPCQFGPHPKCHGRSDFACEPTYRHVPVACDVDRDCASGAVCRGGSCYLVTPLCLPRCNGPADCPPTAHCDPVSGECVATLTSGEPAGSRCDPASAPDNCRGLCLESANEVGGRCTEFCTLGATPACGDDAACVVTIAGTPGAAAGDQGACAELCDCEDPCGHGLSCLELARPPLGARGYCGVATGEQSFVDCGAAGAAGTRG